MIAVHAAMPRPRGLSVTAALRRSSGRRSASRGLTLVELLVAMGLGLVIITALVSLYANVTRSNQEMAKTNLLIENGRFAVQLLQEDVQLAGFWGPLDTLAATAVPNPCVAYGAWGTGTARAQYVNNLLAIPVQGYSDGTPYAACGGDLANVVANSDVLFVRHASSCAVGADCEGGGDTGPHIQVSACRTGGTPEPAYVVETTTDMDARTPRIRKKGCDTDPTNDGNPAAEPEADRRRLLSNIYFVANSPAGVPTLMRMSYQNGAFGAAQPLVEGIEAFKVEYGIDELGTNGLPISATNPPDGNTDRYQSCTAGTPCTLAVLANVVTVKLHILARNLERTPGYTDVKAYTVGPLNIAAVNDGFKRHVFTTTVRLVNPSSRREIP